MTVKQCLGELLDLVAKYSKIYRGPYLPSRVGLVNADPGSNILRESLADHVGALPIVATFLYPHLNTKMDLGKVLTMLSIHDIGELVVGDVLTVKRPKTEQEVTNERQAALSELDPSYHTLFTEFEEYESVEAKFAYSIDKISPNLYELIIDKEFAQERHSHFGFSILRAVEKDRSKMEWDRFLLNFYDELIDQVKIKFGQD